MIRNIALTCCIWESDGYSYCDCEIRLDLAAVQQAVTALPRFTRMDLLVESLSPNLATTLLAEKTLNVAQALGAALRLTIHIDSHLENLRLEIEKRIYQKSVSGEKTQRIFASCIWHKGL